MEAPLAIDDKSKTLPPYGAAHPPPHPPPQLPLHHHPLPSHPLHHPPPPGPQRMLPPSEAPHRGLPAPTPHAIYDQQWRQPYPPPHFDNVDQRRHSTTGPPHNPPHPAYPHSQPSRELPQLPTADPYPRPNSLPAPPPTQSPPDAHPSHPFRPINGPPPEPAPPHSAPGDYAPRIPYPPPSHDPAAPTNGEPQAHYMPPMAAQVAATPGASYDNSYYPFARQRKAARAQQACDQCRARKAKCDEGRPSCSHCRENNINCVYKEIPPHKQEKATQAVLDRVERVEENIEKRFEAQSREIRELRDLILRLPAAAMVPSPSADIAESTKPTPTTQEPHQETHPEPPSDQESTQINRPPQQKEHQEIKVDDQTDDVQMTGLSTDSLSTHSESTSSLPPNGLSMNNRPLNAFPVTGLPITNVSLSGLPAKSLPNSNLSSSSPKSTLSKGNYSKNNNVIHDIARSNMLREQMEEIVNPVIDEPLVKDERDGDLSIPIEHTTAAHKLLTWPSIRRLLDDDIDTDYVMKLEEDRGLIRIYGCGEGRDESSEYYDFTQKKHASVGSPSTTSSSPSFEEEFRQPSFPSWGVGLPATSPRPSERLVDNPGGLDPSGYLNTQGDTVRHLHRKFMEHIHLLHPFLDELVLSQNIERFIVRYGGNNFISQSGTSSMEARGAKRKRSLEGMHVGSVDMSRSPSSHSSTDRWQPQRIERSVENAIILLVLALGAICDYDGEILPPFAPDPNEKLKENGMVSASPNARAPSSSHILSPNSDSGTTGMVPFNSPNLSSGDGSNWRTGAVRYPSAAAYESPDFSHVKKNMDVVPGLAYYAYATDILGNLQGGSGLLHVQAALLAGLYAGQLAHPFQSHGWIYQASRACLVLVRKKNYNAMKEGPMKDLYNFAYWTCLQLESDILAELDLPASGISRAENRIDLPKGIYTLRLTENPKNAMVMFFYSAQIHLRKVLNRVHTDLYKQEDHPDNQKTGKKKPSKGLGFSTSVLQVLGLNLDFWRKSLPDNMKWNDDDPPSPDINTARLRAKYYGARYIIYRPLLHYALHGCIDSEDNWMIANSMSLQSGPKIEKASSFTSYTTETSSMTRWSSGVSDRHDDIHRSEDWENLHPTVQQACKLCIAAAIRSTESFHGIRGRPIITNIFGTAHAQFGNMLVLSATYMSSLGHLVEGDTLRRLLKRTIDFLNDSKHISPTLKKDAEILAGIQRKIFPESAGNSKMTPNSSFTS